MTVRYPIQATVGIFLIGASFASMPATAISGQKFATAADNQTEQLVDYQRADGRRIRIQRHFTDRGPTVEHRALARQLKHLPMVQLRRGRDWITSVIDGNQLITFLVRRQPARTRVLTTRVLLSTHGSAPLDSSLPSWWPAMRQPWVRRSTDGPVQASTLLGWIHQPLAHVRTEIISAAGRAGFALMRHATAGGHQRFDTGHWIWLVKDGHELMVTLSAQQHRTGVVAHLREVVR